MDGHLGFFVLQVLLVVGFDRNYMLGLLVDSSAHNGEGSLADLEADLELSQLQRLLVWI